MAPETARQAAALVEGCGARYLDAPFAGSRADAEARRLAYFVGGTDEAVHAARPVLQATARRVIHVGGVGDAALLKLAAQTLNAVTVQGTAEALAVLRAGGGDPEKLREVLAEEPSHSALAAEKLAAMSAGRLDPVLPVRHVFRDLQVAMRLAGAARAAVPAAGATAGILFGAVRRGLEDRDVAVLGVPASVAAAAASASGLSATVSVPASPATAPEPVLPSPVVAPTARPPGSMSARPSPTVSFVPLTPRQPPPQPVPPAHPALAAGTVSVPVAAMLAPLHRAAAVPSGTSLVPVLPAFRGHGPITSRIPSPTSSVSVLPREEQDSDARPPENHVEVSAAEPTPLELSLVEGEATEPPPAFDVAELSPDGLAEARDAVEVVAPSDIRPPGLRPTGPVPTGSPGSCIAPPPRPRGWMKRLFGRPPAGRPSP